jgi:hypothetical protein
MGPTYTREQLLRHLIRETLTEIRRPGPAVEPPDDFLGFTPEGDPVILFTRGSRSLGLGWVNHDGQSVIQVVSPFEEYASFDLDLHDPLIGGKKPKLSEAARKFCRSVLDDIEASFGMRPKFAMLNPRGRNIYKFLPDKIYFNNSKGGLDWSDQKGFPVLKNGYARPATFRTEAEKAAGETINAVITKDYTTASSPMAWTLAIGDHVIDLSNFVRSLAADGLMERATKGVDYNEAYILNYPTTQIQRVLRKKLTREILKHAPPNVKFIVKGKKLPVTATGLATLVFTGMDSHARNAVESNGIFLRTKRSGHTPEVVTFHAYPGSVLLKPNQGLDISFNLRNPDRRDLLERQLNGTVIRATIEEIEIENDGVRLKIPKQNLYQTGHDPAKLQKLVITFNSSEPVEKIVKILESRQKMAVTMKLETTFTTIEGNVNVYGLVLPARDAEQLVQPIYRKTVDFGEMIGKIIYDRVANSQSLIEVLPYTTDTYFLDEYLPEIVEQIIPAILSDMSSGLGVDITGEQIASRVWNTERHNFDYESMIDAIIKKFKECAAATEATIQAVQEELKKARGQA